MAANGCNFCGKVGIQPISNKRTTFNYDCLEVKNKKSNKTENQKKNEKYQSSENCKVTYLKPMIILTIFVYWLIEQDSIYVTIDIDTITFTCKDYFP